MRTLILNSAFAITFCWAAAVLLVRRWLAPKTPRRTEVSTRCAGVVTIEVTDGMFVSPETQSNLRA
jgi:hypothetical protein